MMWFSDRSGGAPRSDVVTLVGNGGVTSVLREVVVKHLVHLIGEMVALVFLSLYECSYFYCSYSFHYMNVHISIVHIPFII